MKTRHLTMGVGTTLLTSLLLLGIFEVVVRSYHPQPPIQQKHRPLNLNRGQFTHPGVHLNQTREYSVQVHVNKYGFVDQEWEIPNPESTLLIGDSFVQAAQVELVEGLGRQLEHTLHSPMLSIGVPGAGTTTAYLLLKKWLPTIKPRQVLIGILLSNDILNNHPNLESKTDKPFAHLKDGQLVFDIEPMQTTHIPKSLLNYSHGFRWVERTLNHQAQIQHKTTLTPHPLDYDVYLEDKAQSSTTWMDSWTITTALINEIQTLCTNQQVDVKYVLLPSLEEVSIQRQHTLATEYPSLMHANYQGPHDTVIAKLQSIGISADNIIDLYDDFMDHPDPDSLYFPIDGHWTASGHRLAAQSIAQHLLAQE